MKADVNADTAAFYSVRRVFRVFSETVGNKMNRGMGDGMAAGYGTAPCGWPHAFRDTVPHGSIFRLRPAAICAIFEV